ncbi:hypothetical protein [Alkalihalobacterium alkalinitrilicum]|uniref:hypothetical protein n=1 Tax=Alkalihalobacterium alkalinitrilicum TaxID=427920 RepID=UPI0013038BE9|nr:hypothetical protein [Alkalihalobacterium alkalinitrilicum]
MTQLRKEKLLELALQFLHFIEDAINKPAPTGGVNNPIVKRIFQQGILQITVMFV